MNKILYKELKLSASPLSYVFIASALLTFVPGYPILLGAFFTTLGIFYSFQTMRENNDIYYSVLLPVAKSDVVKSKFVFTLFAEFCSFVIITVITLIRMTVLKDAKIYTSNALMNANLVFLGFVFLIFGLFNYLFVRGFFRTACYFGKPFILYCVVTFIIITIAETLHHIPGMEILNSFGFDNISVQFIALGIGLIIFILLTTLAIKRSVKSFEIIDL